MFRKPLFIYLISLHNSTMFRIRAVILAGLIVASSMASAESYVVKIYGVPTGFDRMMSWGGGDNGMMSGSVFSGGRSYAAYLTQAGGFKNMHPSGWYSSEISDSWASTYHCGFGNMTSVESPRALFWVGGGTSVNLHPTGSEYAASAAMGGGGQFQAGYVQGLIPCTQCQVTSGYHAAMWSRTASSFRRLHSTTHKDHAAYSTDGAAFVGAGKNRSNAQEQALLWSSPTSMAVSLHPTGATESSAYSVWAGQQGGYFLGPATSSKPHAALWSGTAGSVIDLNPNATFVSSQVKAMRGTLQVGQGSAHTSPNRIQAIAWHGKAATWINLHSRLPSPFNQWHSTASGIDNLGNIIGCIQSADGQQSRAVVWVRQ